MPDFMYRAEVRQYCGCAVSEFGVEDYYVTSPEVTVTKYRVRKQTPKGVWIEHGLGGKRFVLLSARKRFACPTETEALESLAARKRAQIRHTEARLKRVRSHLSAVESRLAKRGGL